MKEIVLKEFADLRRVGRARLRVRAVRLEGQNKAYLDIRMYKGGRVPTPWTWRGIRITAKEFAALLRLAPRIQRSLSAQPVRRLRKRVPLR